MTQPPNPGVPDEWSAREVADRIAAGDPITLLDVREPAEHAHAAIAAPRALFVPMNDVPVSEDEIREAAADGLLVVYCHHGVRSMHVAHWLASRGMTGLVNLRGGIDAWSLDVDPAVPRYF